METGPCVICGHDEQDEGVRYYVVESPDKSEVTLCSLRCLVRWTELEDIAVTVAAGFDEDAG